MSKTKYVHYTNRGFWAYDVALGVFLKHLIDAVRKGLKVSDTDGKQIGATATQVLVVNEEGLIAGLAENTLASLMAGQPIVGDVLICKRWEIR